MSDRERHWTVSIGAFVSRKSRWTGTGMGDRERLRGVVAIVGAWASPGAKLRSCAFDSRPYLIALEAQKYADSTSIRNAKLVVQ
jgi:hypothetical protein